MVTDDGTIIILVMEGILYFLIAAMTLRGGDFQKRAKRALVFYVALACGWTLYQIVWRLGWFGLADQASDLLQHIPAYGVVALALLLFQLTRAFLRLEALDRRWWGMGAAWLAVLIVLDGNLLSLADVLWRGGGLVLRRSRLSTGVSLAGWAAFMIPTIIVTVRTYRQTRQPLHRNRITYWWPVLAFTLVGDVLFLVGVEAIGGGVRLLGTLVATSAVLTHHLPDVRQTARRAVSYLFITLLTVAIYTAGFATMQYLFERVPGYSPVLAGAAMALILAILFQPLLRLVQRLVNQLIFGSGYDPSQTLRQYSTSISNILDLGLLANVMVKLISEALGIRYGRLFLVDHGRTEEGDGAYHLRDVGGTETEKAAPGVLPDGSPVVDYLHGEQQPLAQYDVDLLPRFQEISSEERDWLLGLGADVYVPIHAKEEWMGLLALGPKVSGDRYFEQDLVLLSTLADQTAVALENARLVEGLIQANTDLGRAYADLNKANRQLQELDKLKSAFIGVITHELRTPFANMLFSLEILERHGQKHLPEELQEQVEQLAEGVQSAKMMIDNLVTFATFLSKQGELRPAELDFGQVVKESLLPLQPLAQSKQVSLHTELPEELPAVQGDQERLSDAIYHLVHNAIKFTGSGGDVWVRCQVTDGRVRFEVQDTGVGVPAEKLPTLWEDFTQMADPLRRGVEGLGLGLALVRYVATAHGGDVWAESKEAVGSTFGFDIPRKT